MHFPATADFVFTHNRAVIFRLASNNTRRATCASVEVDDHSPTMNLFGVFVPFHRIVVICIRKKGQRDGFAMAVTFFFMIMTVIVSFVIIFLCVRISCFVTFVTSQ